MEHLRYSIAGHTIQISGEGFNFLPGFDFFRSEKPAGPPVLTIYPEADVGDWDLPPVFRSEYEATIYDLSVREEAWLIRMKSPEGSCLRAEIRRNAAGFQAGVQQTGVFGQASLHFFCWLLFGVAAVCRQTVAIHASGVMYKGKTVLFLGESGTGKSTHTQLWLQSIPDTELLNDDSPFLNLNNDIRVYGSPWSGKTRCYKAVFTPLAALVRLRQSPFNRIRRLSSLEAIGAVFPSFPREYAYDKTLSGYIQDILSKLLQQTPVYVLDCLPDTAAAKLVFDTLKNDGRL